MTVSLHGFQYSVYSWIARLALEEKGADYDWIEVDPFACELLALERAHCLSPHSMLKAFPARADS